ncbi:5-formyltetrahydrofolate cyclo-ligase [Acidiferrobacter sp.]|uniref:5-formyltetrahydrofolate cyclo-ligase n=1 Tax=Acidiferrobacter sp. TaxID=1872107 RepID=UPI0026184A35|nr:5-formyltetrahydrofolate cyclo-ligase [Acidiferrobacter sp.]
MHDKHDLRRTLRECRRAVGARARATSARQVARRGLPLLRGAHHVGIYWPVGSELDPRPLARALMRAHRAVYLPVTDHRPGRPLAFVPWRPPFVPGPLRIPEPRWGRRVRARRLDAVLVPLVGFDARGWRLGQGGGHYDRTFGFVRKARGRPVLIGLAYECQRLTQAPREGHDVRLHAVLTERRLYRAQDAVV